MPKEHDCYNADRVVRQFETLYTISTAVQKELRGKETFEEILGVINDAIDYSSACILILDKEKKRLDKIAKTGTKDDLISFVDFELGAGFSAWVAKYRRPIIMPNIKRYRESLDNHIRSFISVPILMDNELIGVLNVGNERAGTYDDNDLKLACIIANQISVLIERIHFRNEILKRDSIINKIKGDNAEAQVQDKTNIGKCLADIQQGISEPIASMAGNTRFLQLSLKEADQRLKKSLDEIEESITKLSDFSYQLEDISKL
ncbi:MAG: GAF domain-containing protein [candidate division Zixibacteria bacterium]|nr:GAF domain-containing protein [candidate division Zixibacteria bacterium]